MDKALKIEYVKTKDLNPAPGNPRVQEKDLLTASVSLFGFLVPILINSKNEIVCGAMRWKAACKLGLEEIPCIRVSLTEEEQKAFRIADNCVCEVSNWNWRQLEREKRKTKMDLASFDLGVDEAKLIDIDKLMRGRKNLQLSFEEVQE